MNTSTTCTGRLKLVDVGTFKRLIDDFDLDDKKKACIAARWLLYVRWWDMRAAKAKRPFRGMQIGVVCGSASIPALVALREMQATASYAMWLAIATVAVSLIVAICSGLENLFGWGAVWREKRGAAELIKSEGFSFYSLSGEYAEFKTHEEGYKRFMENVESQIRAEIKDYVMATTPKSKAPDQPDGNTGPKPTEK
jgi:hypothetical protein